MSKPTDKLSMANPVHLLATGFGSGLSAVVPGTMGTLAAVPFYLLMTQLPVTAYWGIVAIASLVGIYLCGKTSSDMEVHDHGSIVWDEFVGFWITMGVVSVVSWQSVLAGFMVFRAFDMIKPWPIKWFDQHVHGGFGIMLDDIVAGVMSAVTMFLLSHWFGWW